MENNKLEKDMSLKGVLDGFIQSYAQRDTDVAFTDWLAERLRQEMPEMDSDACARMTNGIIEAVAGYDQALQNLNHAIETGQSKDEWLAEKLEKEYDGMPMDDVGKALQHMESDLVSSNMQVMGETGSMAAEDVPSEWNKYDTKAKAYGIGQKLEAVAICAAANALEAKVNEDEVAVSDIVVGALQNGLNASPSEVKAVVAGAVRAAAEKGLADALPSDTPNEVIGNFAGVAVEGAMVLYDAAKGNIGMIEAVDNIGRAGVAAGCRIGAGYLKKYVMNLPHGLLLADLLGGLFEHMESPKFINNVYTVVRDAAIDTWKGIKQSIVGKAAGELFDVAKQALLN